MVSFQNVSVCATQPSLVHCHTHPNNEGRAWQHKSHKLTFFRSYFYFCELPIFCYILAAKELLVPGHHFLSRGTVKYICMVNFKAFFPPFKKQVNPLQILKINFSPTLEKGQYFPSCEKNMEAEKTTSPFILYCLFPPCLGICRPYIRGRDLGTNTPSLAFAGRRDKLF